MPCEQTWFTAADGLRLRRRTWLPARPARADVIFIHGFSEHSLRHAQAAEALTDRGYAIHAIDLRGHGESAGPRVWIRSFDEYLDDVNRFIELVREGLRRRPLFAWGNSMGGTIVVLLAIERGIALDGLVLTGAFLKLPEHLFPILRYLAIAFGRIVPGLRVARVGARYLSRDPEVVRAYEADPLVHDRITLRSGNELLRATRWALAHAGEFSLPLLLMHGTADRIAFPEGSIELARPIRGDCTLKLWEGFYHEVHNEPEKAQVLAFVIEWLEAHT